MRERSCAPITSCSEGVQGFGGTVEKFIGDAVMAVVGARAHTRTMPSERCVRGSASSSRSNN